MKLTILCFLKLLDLAYSLSPYDSDRKQIDSTHPHDSSIFHDAGFLPEIMESNDQKLGVNPEGAFVPYGFIDSDKSVHETSQNDTNFENYKPFSEAIGSILNDQASGINPKTEFVPYETKSDKYVYETPQNHKKMENYNPFSEVIESKLNDQTSGINNKEEFVPYDSIKSDKSVYETTTQNNKNIEDNGPSAKVIEPKLDYQIFGINLKGEFVPYDFFKSDKSVYETFQNDKMFEDYKPFAKVIDTKLNDQTFGINPKEEFVPYDFFKSDKSVYETSQKDKKFEDYKPLSEVIYSVLNDQTSGISSKTGIVPYDPKYEKFVYETTKDKIYEYKPFSEPMESQFNDGASEINPEEEFLPHDFTKRGGNSYKIPNSYKNVEDSLSLSGTAKEGGVQLENDNQQKEEMVEQSQKYLPKIVTAYDYGDEENDSEKYKDKYLPAKYIEERKIEENSSVQRNFMPLQDGIKTPEKALPKQKTYLKQLEREYEAPEVIQESQNIVHEKYLDGDSYLPDYNQRDIHGFEKSPEKYEEFMKNYEERRIVEPQLYTKEQNAYMDDEDNSREVEKSVKKQIQLKNHKWDAMRTDVHQDAILRHQTYPEEQESGLLATKILSREGINDFLKENNDTSTKLPDLDNYLGSFVSSFRENYKEIEEENRNSNEPKIFSIAPEVVAKEKAIEMNEKFHNVKGTFEKIRKQLRHILHQENTIRELENTDYKNDLKKHKSFSDPQRIIIKPKIIIEEMSEEIPEQHNIEETFTKAGELLKNDYQPEKLETPTMMTDFEDSEYKENLRMHNRFDGTESIIISPQPIVEEISVVPKQSNIEEDFLKREEQLQDLRQFEKPETPVFDDLEDKIKLQKHALFNEPERIIIKPMPVMEEMIAAVPKQHDMEDIFKESPSEIRAERQNIFINEKSEIPIALTEMDNSGYSKSVKMSALLNEPRRFIIQPQVITKEMIMDLPEISSREEPDTTKDQLSDHFEVVAKNNKKYMTKPLNLSKNVKTDFYLQGKSGRQELERETLTPSYLRKIPQANTPTQGEQESGFAKARPSLFKQYERYIPLLQIFNGEQRKLSATPKIVKELGQHSGLTKQISYLAEQLDGFFETQKLFGASNGFSSTAVKLFLTPEVKSQKLDQLSAKQSRMEDATASSRKQECSYRASFEPKDNSKEFLIKISYHCKSVPGHQNKKSNIFKSFPQFEDYLYDPNRILRNEGSGGNQVESKVIKDQLNKNNSPSSSMIPQNLQPMQFHEGLGHEQKMTLPHHFTVTENNNEQRRKTFQFPKKLMKRIKKLLKKFQGNNNPQILLKISDLINKNKFQSKIPLKNTKTNSAAIKIEKRFGMFPKPSEVFEKYPESHSAPIINSDFVIEDLKLPMKIKIVKEQNQKNIERSEHTDEHSSKKPEQSNKLPETEEHVEHNFEKVNQLEKLGIQVEHDVKHPYEILQNPGQFDELFQKQYYPHEPEIQIYGEDENVNNFNKLDSSYKNLQKTFHLSPDLTNTIDEVLRFLIQRFFIGDSKDSQKRINIEDKYWMQIPK